MTTQQVAKKLRVQNRTVIEYINRDRIKCTWEKDADGKFRRFISKAAFAKYLRTKKPVGHPPGRMRKRKTKPEE